MRLRLGFLIVGLLLAFARTVHGQPPLLLVWNQNDATPTEAQAFIYRYYLNTQPGQVLSGVTCAVVALPTGSTGTECRAPLPEPPIGTHELYITAANAIAEGLPSAKITFKYPAVPGSPTNLHIVKGEGA